jgi:beta-lactam-binding protein with PASTA domain
MNTRKCFAAAIALLCLACFAQPALAQTYTTLKASANHVPAPKIIGMPIDKAREAAKKAGFGLAVSYQETQNKAIDGTVAKQPDNVAKTATSFPVTVWKYKEIIAVPNVVGMTPDQAKQAAEKAGYAFEVDNRRVESTTQAALGGKAATQTPKAGEMNAANRMITVVLYYKVSVVPNIVGMTAEQAKQAVESAGLRWAVALRTIAHSDLKKSGRVSAQSHAPGSQQTAGTVVTTDVYETIQQRVAPNLVGMTQEQARLVAERAGFALSPNPYGPVDNYKAADLDGKIATQSPKPGESVLGGKSIPIKVDVYGKVKSAGVADVIVPSVVGMTPEQAQQTLQKAGLSPKVSATQWPNEDPALSGKVYFHKPQANYSAPIKSVVEITLYAQALPRVPNIVGMPLDQAKKELEKVGLKADVSPTGKDTADKNAAGKVYRQQLEPGTKLSRGAGVGIEIWQFKPAPSACELLWNAYSGIDPWRKPQEALAAADKIMASSCDASMKCCAWFGIGRAKDSLGNALTNYQAAADAYDKRLACTSSLCPSDLDLSRRRRDDIKGMLGGIKNAGETKAKSDALFASGNEKAKSRNYQGAIADYNRLISEFPNTAPVCTARYNRGLCKEGFGDLTGASADYGDALKCTGGNADIQKASDRVKAAIAGQGCAAAMKSASDKLAKGDNKGAADEFGKAAGMCPAPRRCAAVSDRGLVKERMGDNLGALVDYEEGFKCDPQNAGLKTTLANGRYNVANVHSTAGRFDDAIRLYLSALELKPDFTQARHNLSLAYWGRGMTREQQGALENAAADFTSALKADPTNKRAQDGQARVKARLEESKKRASTGSGAR